MPKILREDEYEPLGWLSNDVVRTLSNRTTTAIAGAKSLIVVVVSFGWVTVKSKEEKIDSTVFCEGYVWRKDGFPGSLAIESSTSAIISKHLI